MNIPKKVFDEFYSFKTVAYQNMFRVKFEKIKSKDNGDIKYWLVKDVTFSDQIKFKTEALKSVGSVKLFSLPAEYDGIDVTITFEETKNYDVENLISQLQTNYITSAGVMKTAGDIGSITVEAFAPPIDDKSESEGDPKFKVVARYIFNNCHFLNADQISYGYESATSISRKLSFKAESLTKEILE